MNYEQMAYWIAKEYGHRVSHPPTGMRSRWRLDGVRTSVPSIWMKLVYPRIESGEISISFPQNVHDMYKAFDKVSYAKYQLEKEDYNAR